MKGKLNALLTFGLTGTIIFGSFFAGEYLEATRGNNDMWWTPMNMALSLDQSRTEFELYIQKDMLQKQIEKGTLLVANEKGKPAKVTAGDVKVCLNNWHKVKAEKLNYCVITAFFLGASLALLVVGLIRFMNSKDGNA